MAKIVQGSIIATVIETGLKTVFYVYTEDRIVTFKKPDNPEWSHICHSSNEENSDGWVNEVNELTVSGTHKGQSIPVKYCKDAQFFPVVKKT